MSSLSVRAITAAEHLAFVRRIGTASFLQIPTWARVKAEWRGESVGWWHDGDLVGVALVLHRPVPRLRRRTLAYLPEGPVLDWDTDDITTWLQPLAAYLKAQGAFAVRIGPAVVTRRWDAARIKDGIADQTVTSLTEIPPSAQERVGAAIVSQLRELGWREQGGTGGFAAGQPRFNFQIPLAGRDEAALLAGMNQLWRRNIKKATKAGVEITCIAGTEAGDAEIGAFHDLYVHTAARDGFTPRPRGYFTTMLRDLADDDPDGTVDIRLYLAHHDGDLVAATIWIRVGSHAWYSYGASSSDKREVRGSNAIQWRMIQDSIAAGAEVYDLRGITDTVATGDPQLGLIQFKVGTGGEAVEYVGEWDLPLNRPLYTAFELYMKRRG